MPESFLVDIPMTNATGDAWVYDIAVEPKVATAAGSVILNKIDEDGRRLVGTTFTVQVSSKVSDNTWSTWAGYVPEGGSSVLQLTTNNDGQITVENLPITIDGKEVRFRFFEESVSDSDEKEYDYIINNSKLDYFYVQENGKTVVVHADGTSEQPADVGRIQMINDKTGVTKTLKRDDGTYFDQISAGITDTLDYKIEIDVPSRIAELRTFEMVDELPVGIKDRHNLKIVGVKDGAETTLTENNVYTKTETEKVLTLVFTPAELSGYDTVKITYNAYIDIENADIGFMGFFANSKNTNKAKLTYTNNINASGSQVSTRDDYAFGYVQTGGLKIKKVDSAGNVLPGAVFKIAETEADAKAGNFLKDYEGNEIVATSGEDGYAIINGLAYNDDGVLYYRESDTSYQAKDYYLVETQAPSYTETTDEGEVTKYYKLLSKPLKVTVTGYSHNDTIEVVNRKELELPLTGGIGIAIFAVVGITIMAMSVAANKKEAKDSANV